MCSSRQLRGFTLVEILIVLGIIALLTAILLPVLGRARENGRKVACASNLRQLGLAFQQYTDDWNRRYPLAANFQAWGNDGYWVKGVSGTAVAEVNPNANGNGVYDYIDGTHVDIENGALYPYVKNAQVYICPSTPDGKKKGLSYSMNCAVSVLSSVRIRQPAEIVLLVDEDRVLNDGYFYARDTTGTADNSTDALTQSHNGGGNLLFCDGHVKFYPFKKFVLDDSPRGLQNKSQMTGIPRFHDKAFGGTTGTSQAGLDATGLGTLNTTLDTCAVPKPTP